MQEDEIREITGVFPRFGPHEGNYHCGDQC